jgi:predicted Fe-S protein YdhL (DUF1289 family)
VKSIDDIFAALQKSAFRRRFHLQAAERAYLQQQGLPTVLAHARDFVDKRLAPANPAKDGKQTPFRGHPVFVAQHATATCCRGCLAKWHEIPHGRMLDAQERDHVVAALEHWLRMEAARPQVAEPRIRKSGGSVQGSLF